MEFGNGDFAFDKRASVFERCGDEHGDRRVKEGDPPTDFAREGVEVRGWGTTFPA